MLPVDHLIFGAPDLEEAVALLAVRTGVTAAPGGRHPAWGTHNALLALGPDVYLEILAPDPLRARPDPPTLFGLDEVRTPRLVAWCARVPTAEELEGRVAQAREAGVALGDIGSGQRDVASGPPLRFSFSDPLARPYDGIAPFLVHWGDTPHPARSAPGGLRLLRFTGAHPRGRALGAALASFGVSLDVARGPKPVLRAVIEGPVGRVELT